VKDHRLLSITQHSVSFAPFSEIFEKDGGVNFDRVGAENSGPPKRARNMGIDSVCGINPARHHAA
jgi:hypothetical protein